MIRKFHCVSLLTMVFFVSPALLYPASRAVPLLDPRYDSSNWGDTEVIHFADAAFTLETKKPIPREEMDDIVRWVEDQKNPIQVRPYILIRYKVAKVSVKSMRPFNWYEYTFYMVPTIDSDSLELLLEKSRKQMGWIHTIINFVDDKPLIFHNLWYTGRLKPVNEDESSSMQPETNTDDKNVEMKWTTQKHPEGKWTTQASELGDTNAEKPQSSSESNSSADDGDSTTSAEDIIPTMAVAETNRPAEVTIMAILMPNETVSTIISLEVEKANPETQNSPSTTPSTETSSLIFTEALTLPFIEDSTQTQETTTTIIGISSMDLPVTEEGFQNSSDGEEIKNTMKPSIEAFTTYQTDKIKSSTYSSDVTTYHLENLESVTAIMQESTTSAPSSVNQTTTDTQTPPINRTKTTTDLTLTTFTSTPSVLSSDTSTNPTVSTNSNDSPSRESDFSIPESTANPESTFKNDFTTVEVSTVTETPKRETTLTQEIDYSTIVPSTLLPTV